MILRSRVRTRLLTHFHFISSFEKILSLAVMSLGKWVADLGKWVAGYELSIRRDDRGEDETHPQRNVRHVESASSKRNSQPRPILGKIKSWKVKDTIMKEARKKKPKDTRFIDDFAKRTLDRRASKIPEMLEARKTGKTAFLIMDKLVVYVSMTGHLILTELKEVKIGPRSSGGSAKKLSSEKSYLDLINR